MIIQSNLYVVTFQWNIKIESHKKGGHLIHLICVVHTKFNILGFHLINIQCTLKGN